MKEMVLRYEETGETRPPRRGEFFRSGTKVTRAEFDFHATEFPIVREILEEKPDSGTADGK